MAAARKRSGGMSPVEWAVAIGGFSLFVIGVVLVIVVASMRGPATVEVAQAPAQPAAAPVVAPSAPAAPNPYATNPYSPGPPPPTAPPAAPSIAPPSAGAQPPQGEVIEVVAQRMERAAPQPVPEERSFWGNDSGGRQQGGSRRWILRQWWGPPLIMLLCILGGGYTMLAAVVDSDAVFVHGRHAPHIADLFGRPAARIYYFCLGGVVMFFGLAPVFAYFR